jgi:hypothetical protein
VAGDNGELRRIGSQLLVLLGGEFDSGCAGLVAALTNDHEPLAYGRGPIVELLELLVDVAEQRFVFANATGALVHGHQPPPDVPSCANRSACSPAWPTFSTIS